MSKMKRLSTWILASLVLALAATPLLAERQPGGKARVVTRSAAGDGKTPRLEHKATAESYSAQVNIVTRVQGTSLFKTAIDITNNTDSSPVIATLQYCYQLASGFAGCTLGVDIELLNFDNFHTDDMVQYLGGLGVIPPDAQNSSFGTLLVTFDGLPSAFGWEGTVTARTYSPYSQANPALGTVAIAYPGSLFFESANTTLVATIRDTVPAPTEAGALRTNLGVTNTDLNGLGPSNPVSVRMQFFDVTEGSPTNGQQVGSELTITGLEPGEVNQLNNVFDLAGIPNNVSSCIVFVDITSPLSGFPTIEGYVNILDGGTQDGAYFEMKCADTDFCGN
jgi:hypothetical protein